MSAVISDTDILSAFGKIARVELLLLLFQKVHVALGVYGDRRDRGARSYTHYSQRADPWQLNHRYSVSTSRCHSHRPAEGEADALSELCA